jgi:alginate O-acetyltransferase complex protein AlgI
MRIGLFMFVWGLFKKMVIADRLAWYVDPVYGNVHAYSGLPLLIATYCYTLQIYFDFSGYTDMALGSARLFNINLTQNFNRPYLAISIGEFWRRWHISFSRWILDYIFKPLQMSWRGHGRYGTALALIVTFLVSGGWHGATWGFVVWGGLHGVYLACSLFWKPWQKILHNKLGVAGSLRLKVWQTVITFNLVAFAWIFFRSGSLEDAWYVMTSLFSGTDGVQRLLLTRGSINVVELLFALAVAVIIGKLCYDKAGRCIITTHGTLIRWSLYYGIGMAILLANAGASSSYIYFRF